MFNLRCHPTFQKSVPISNRLYSKPYPKTALKLKIPTSPESDGEVYLTPNTSVALPDDQADILLTKEDGDGMPNMFGRLRERNTKQPTSSLNGYRANKIQSMSNIPERNGHGTIKNHRHQNGTAAAGGVNGLQTNGTTGAGDGEDQVDSGMDENTYCTPENSFNGMHRMQSLGNLSQYEMSFGATPKSLAKLKEELEMRQLALTKRRSLTNLYESNLKQSECNDGAGDKRESIFGPKPTTHTAKYKRKIGIGDTKYIGIDDNTPDKSYQLTKMKSLGTIPDLVSERISYDPFWTPMVGRRHPASLCNGSSGGNGGGGDNDRQSTRTFDDSNGSSDFDDESDFLRHQPDEHVRFMNETDLMRGSFERGFRRSYNRKYDDTAKQPLRQSDGYFQMPPPVGKKPISHRQQQQQSQGGEQRNRSSVHSLPSDGRFEVIIRYDLYSVLSFPFSPFSPINKNKQKKKDKK